MFPRRPTIVPPEKHPGRGPYEKASSRIRRRTFAGRRVRRGKQQFLDQLVGDAVDRRRVAKPVREAKAMRFLGGKALARQQIAAQRPIADSPRKKADQWRRRKAEPHLGNREERIAAGDVDEARCY